MFRKFTCCSHPVWIVEGKLDVFNPVSPHWSWMVGQPALHPLPLSWCVFGSPGMRFVVRAPSFGVMGFGLPRSGLTLGRWMGDGCDKFLN